MKLYFTPGSPYARMARIVVIEKGLAPRVEAIIATTRQEDSPYYRINPSGRVPYLVCDDGVGMEGSALICAYLDQLDGEPTLSATVGSDDWEALRLEAAARSTLDGLAVWARELRRPDSERSPATLAHEAARASRMADFWEQAADPLLRAAPFNLLQIVLGCALGLESRLPAFEWHAGHPKLHAWYAAISRRPSFIATQPPTPA